MSYGVIIGGATSGAFQVLNTDGSLVRDLDPYSAPAVAADDQYFYVSHLDSVYKYTRDLTEVWHRSHGDTIRGIAVDSQGDVYICGNRRVSVTHRKLAASDGSIIWSKDHGGDLYCIAVDADDYIYIGGTRISDVTHRKLDTDGVPIWSKNHFNTVLAIAVDGEGNVYIGGYPVSTNSFRKYNSSGTLQWSKNINADVYAVAVDSAGNSYTGGARISSITHRKYDSGGTSQWTKDHGAAVRAIAVDEDGHVYIGGDRTSDLTHRKLDADGVPIWSGDRGGAVASLAIFLAGTRVSAGLPFPIRLATPSPAFFAAAPALPFPIRLSPPTVTPAPLPPDWTGPPPQTVYRGYLTGGSTLLEIPMASFQCRRFIGESTWLTVILPTHSASWEAALAARSGGQLVIYAGVRAATGVETMGEMMRAWLTAVEVTQEAWSSRIRLTGRVVPVAFTAQTRTLHNVQSWVSEDGRWEVTCTVDPLLRPNDTAVIGSLSFTVGSIDYEISPARSFMTVKEVLDG